MITPCQEPCIVAVVFGARMQYVGLLLGSIAAWLTLVVLAVALVASVLRVGDAAPRMHWRVVRVGAPCAALVVAVLGGLLHAMTPRDLKTFGVTAAPTGTWVVVHGDTAWPPGLSPSFLLDTVTGRSALIGFMVFEGCFAYYAWVTFSADGQVAVRPKAADYTSASAPVIAQYLGPRRMTRKELTSWKWSESGNLALSPSGRHALTRTGATLQVVDVEGDRIVRTLAAGPFDGRELWTVDDDSHVRAVREVPERSRSRKTCVEILDATMGEGTLHLVATVQAPPGEAWHATRLLSLSPSARRLVVMWRGDTDAALTLHDTATGALVATLRQGREALLRPHQHGFLADDSVVICQSYPETSAVQAFSPEGVAGPRVSLPPSEWATCAGEAWAGHVVIGLEGYKLPNRVVLVDVVAGRVVANLPGLSCVGTMQGSVVGGPSTRLFMEDCEHWGFWKALVELDWASGARRDVLAARGSRRRDD